MSRHNFLHEACPPRHGWITQAVGTPNAEKNVRSRRKMETHLASKRAASHAGGPRFTLRESLASKRTSSEQGAAVTEEIPVKPITMPKHDKEARRTSRGSKPPL